MIGVMGKVPGGRYRTGGEGALSCTWVGALAAPPLNCVGVPLS